MSEYLKPVSGRISSRFGNRVHPITKKLTFHNGIDIACPIGTPVFSPVSGKVTELWDSDRGGKCLAITGIDKVRFGFAHLDSRVVRLGDWVVKGDVIARTGNTGASTGPHLHFTIKIKNEWVDPEKHIKFV